MKTIAKRQKDKTLKIFQGMVKIIRRSFEEGFNPVEVKIDDNYDKSLLYRKWQSNPYSKLQDKGNKTYELTFSEHLWYEITVE